jgi:hypothetical protein
MNERLINERDDDNTEKQPIIDGTFMFYQEEYVQNSRQRSKFFDYFNDLLNQYNNILQNHAMEIEKITNPFNSTELFNLVRFELPLFTLWSVVFFKD